MTTLPFLPGLFFTAASLYAWASLRAEKRRSSEAGQALRAGCVAELERRGR